MNATQPSWTPPLTSQLDFSRDCNIWSEFAKDCYYKGDHAYWEPSAWSIIQLLRSAVPVNETAGAEDWQILQWYAHLVRDKPDPRVPESPFGYESIRINSVACKTELCSKIAFHGNPDLAGIGVQASFAFEMALVTIYFLVWILSALAQEHGFTARTLYTRIREAFQHSLSSFLFSAAVFNISISVATLGVSSRTTPYNTGKTAIFLLANPDAGIYDSVLASLSAMLSFLPVIVLGFMYCESQPRRKWLFVAVLYLNGFLLMAANLHPRSAIFTSDRFAMFSDAFPGVCVSTQFSNFLEYFDWVLRLIYSWNIGVQLALAGAVWMIVQWREGAVQASQRQSGTEIKRNDTFPSDFWFGYRTTAAAVVLCLMWVHFGLFIWTIREIAKPAGSESPVSQWGFGQILAVFTWLPVLAEWGYIFIFGVKEGLNSRVSSGWEVTAKKD